MQLGFLCTSKSSDSRKESRGHRRFPAMNKILLPISLFSLLFAAACGGGGPTPPPAGNFSNSSLKGQYAYRLHGFVYTSATTAALYAEAGVFTADGNGNITSGTDDYLQQGSAVATTTTSGAYSVNNDGTGTIQLNSTALGTITLSITMASSSKVYLIEADAANTYGVAELQNSGNLTTTPSGNLTFRMHDSTVASRAGVFSISNGTLTGSEDLLAGGVLDNNTGSPLPLTGTVTAPVGGRGSGTFNDGLGTVQFLYYVVGANNIRILRTDSGIVSLGRAEAQSGTFTNASFSGSYAFGSRADDSNTNGGINGQNTVGAITADGNGNITGGAYDSVQDGNPTANASISPGTYSVGSDGSVVVNFSTSTGVSIQQIFWMVTPSRAFFLTNDSTKYEDGIADLQQSSSFTTASLSGQYAFVMDGYIVNTSNIDRVGWINGDGAGNMNLFENVNGNGSISSPGVLTGTYTVGTNGRAAATINGLSQANNDLVFYLVSPSQAYILQNFSGYEVFGAMDLQ